MRMPAMLGKTYKPEKIESYHYKKWEDAGNFSCGNQVGAEAYTIVIPPPNVTGSLHMGHALNTTLQDILVRYKRMKGFDVLWQPGTDHAGIATQMVVERNLLEEGKTRHDFKREEFIQKIWDWKAKSGGAITTQLRRLGASCDWSRERFTMDEGLSKAVTKVFVELYKKGLIYRDNRLVNWDSKLKTAISDLEVEQRDHVGSMWYFKYPIEGQIDSFLTVGTTRPETMLGDVAVAVNPDDPRYKELIGKNCILPIVGRSLIIISDAYADPEKGSGAVKITPAHDFNDFEVGKRHNLEMINILDQNADLNSNVPKEYQGLDRYQAREKIIVEMDRLGLLAKVEENLMKVPYGDRSGVIIEPWLTEQWFADAKKLAKSAIDAVESGKIKFVPRQWEKTFFEWMRNIEPWCVSRQIWWGHQIPAWFGPDQEVFVELTEKKALKAAKEFYGKEVELVRDPDVLDTWFSSALWPFSTLGWPENTKELTHYYPTNVLITGFDIIFFWVARMMMMGLEFMGKIPFEKVYIHALVRDENGQKMSKSKGNVIDPIVLIDKYGADALRFTLTALAAQGRDVRLSESRVEGYRNFCTKLWNAARFCEINKCSYRLNFDPNLVQLSVNKWILGMLYETEKDVSSAIEDFRFNDFANTVFQFTRNTFCDWYIEFAKPYLQGWDGHEKLETRETVAWVLDQLLRLMHPVAPFITEDLWDKLNDRRSSPLISTDWPTFSLGLINNEINREMDWVIRLVSQIRGLRTEMNVPSSAIVPLYFKDAGEREVLFLKNHGNMISQLARVCELSLVQNNLPKGSIQAVIDSVTIILKIADFIDVSSENNRIKKEVKVLETEVLYFNKKLNNKKFVLNAPTDIVKNEETKLFNVTEDLKRLKEAQKRLLSLDKQAY